MTSEMNEHGTSERSEDGPVDSLALSMALLHQAKRRLWWSIGLGVLAAVLGLLTIPFQVDTDPLWGPATVALAALLAVASYALFRMYELRYDLACEAKRFTLLERGLGWILPPDARLHLRNRVGPGASRRAQRYRAEADAYYASDRPPGAARLLDLIHESAFFTFNLFRTLRNLLLVLLLALLVIAFVVAWSALVAVDEHEARVTAGRLVMAMIPAILSVGLVSWSFKLTDLANQIEGVTRELDQLGVGGSPDEREVMRLMGEYNCSIVQGLPIPDPLYQNQRPYLNELWEERKRSELKRTGASV